MYVAEPSPNEDVPPWVEWKLGAKDNFLAELQKWNLAHKDQMLPDILEKIDRALDLTPSVVGLIPSSPFPGQSLVTALVSLIQLGIVRDILMPPTHFHSRRKFPGQSKTSIGLLMSSLWISHIWQTYLVTAVVLMVGC